MPRTVQFSEVPVGAEFFDPFSGEECKKTSATEAVMTTGGDYYEGTPAVFKDTDEVQVEG